MPTSRFLHACSAAGIVAVFCIAAAAAPEPSEFDALVERARGVPAEFAADALLRLAASPQAGKARRALIEEAFRRAAGAQQPQRRRSVSPSFRSGPAAFLDRAYAQQLDAGSLQCRAVRAMLPLDRKHARELFYEIPRPQLKRATCDDAMVVDVSAYYETMAEVARSSFTAAEIAGDGPFKLITGYFHGLESPVEAGPVAHLLATAALKPAQLNALAAVYAGALKQLAGDDRAFTFAVSGAGRAGERVGELAAQCARNDLSTIALLEAYRAFLVRHMAGERCADSQDRVGIAFGVAPNPELELAGDPAAYFNKKLRPEAIKAIGDDEIQPAKLEGAAGGLRSCESPECQQLLKLYRGLMMGPNGLPYSAAERAASEWQGKLKELLAAVAAWKDDPTGTPGEQFQQKCLLYGDLFNIVPNGPDRAAVLHGFLDFLERTNYQRENRVEWFLPVNGLVARVSLDPLGLGDLWRDMRNSRDSVIALYAALEQLAPRPPADRLSVM